jgi:hypothetical protein
MQESNGDDNGKLHVEVLLSIVFFVCSCALAIGGALDAMDKNKIMALYKFSIAALSASAACNPFAAVRIALGRVTAPKSMLSYAHLAMPFLGLAALLALAGIVLQRFI